MSEDKVNKISTAIATVLVFSAIALLSLAISWGVCAGFVYLIMLCFGLQFSIATATGVWLLMLLIGVFVNMLRG